MRQLATRITPNLGNRNRKIDQTMVQFSSVLWIFLVHRTEPANTRDTTYRAFDFPAVAQTPRTSLDATNSPEVTTEKSIADMGNDAITK